ncbi:MAG: hypothetical protein KA354_14455 [Phycisphaerae bacterium]|nr:hypothetical protein [Phycisphaerae bacterium]
MPANNPSYRHHKPSGQAIVTIDGKDFYLRPYDTPESQSKYDRLIAMWLAGGRCLPEGKDGMPHLTVDQLIAAYWKVTQARDTARQIIEEFEEVLSYHRITVPSDDAQRATTQVPLCMPEWDKLRDGIVRLLRRETTVGKR